MKVCFTRFAVLYALLFVSAEARYQQPNRPPVPAPAGQIAQTGLETPWAVQDILANLQQDNQQLQSLLSNLNPQQWEQKKGAPGAYILQWQTAKTQLEDVMTTTKLLAQKTDSLPVALDVYFRLEALEITARSLAEGAQRYADRATSDRLNLLIAHNFNSRERFRDYLRDLAATEEQNFKIADDEAQRCRGMISKEPAPSTKRSKRY